MEIYEENQESQVQEPRQAFDPSAGKRVSPFADSPYVDYFESHGQEQPVVQPKVKKKTRAPRKGGRWVSVLLVIALVLSSCGATAFALNQWWQKRYDLLTAATNNKLAVLQEQLNGISGGNAHSGTPVPTEGMTPAQIYQQNVDAVVSIRTNVSSGTGFFISSDGYVVSNYHVVEGATTIQVQTVNGLTYDAKLVGYDKNNDVSLMKIEAENLACVVIGDSDLVAVGDQVVAIGNALGKLAATLTVGYVSGKDRIVSTDGTAINMLQTDASINSGNSGGPLFNAYGEVVGITTAKYTGSSSSGATIEGIGFAIPINDVYGMVEDIRDYGYVTGAYMGVIVKEVDSSMINNYGFPDGVYISEVLEGVSAHRAGIRAMDIIVNLGGYTIDSVNTLDRILRKFEPGDTTTVTVFRGGTEVNLEITFDEKPQPEEQQPTVQEPTQPTEQTPSQGETKPWWYELFPDFFG